jgi:hypothetical protein
MFRYVILSYQRRQMVRVFHQMFLNLVGNIVIISAFREANFVSAIKANVSRCGRQGTTWAYGPNLVWGGGVGTVLVCPTALLTQYTYTTLFEILSGPFLRIFCGGGEHFLNKNLSVR